MSRHRPDAEPVKRTGRAHGWTTFSIDGRFACPGSGDVFDVRTHRVVAHLSDQAGGQSQRVSSFKMIEVHFRGGRVVAVGDQFGVGRKAAAGPPCTTWSSGSAWGSTQANAARPGRPGV